MTTTAASSGLAHGGSWAASLTEIGLARRAGVELLLRHQHADGHWEDYHLPVGRSDAWVTAYVALRLVASGAAREPLVDAAIGRAAAWLRRTRPYAAGWGFNGVTGPDADSTAHAVLLLRWRGGVRHGDIRSDIRSDIAWLLTCWRAAGGFATFDAADGWGAPHTCVTPLAFFALPVGEQRTRRAAVARYVLATRRVDGTWPAYWWRTCCYSTYWNLRLCRALGLDSPAVLDRVGADAGFAPRSLFDLSFIVAIAALERHPACLPLARTLIALQERDGGWAGSDDLRVTRHDVPAGAEDGTCYRDEHGLITTASAIFALGHAGGDADDD